MSDLVGNPEDRFSHNEAHMKVGFKRIKITSVCKRDVIDTLGQLIEINDAVIN